jgi:hypothetical protein
VTEVVYALSQFSTPIIYFPRDGFTQIVGSTLVYDFLGGGGVLYL